MPESDGLGEALIVLCIKTHGFNEAVLHGVREEMFFGKCKEAWDFSVALLKKRSFPSVDELKSRFDLSLDEMPGATIESLVRRLRVRAYLNDLRPVYDSGLKAIKEGDPYKAVDVLLSVGKLKAKYARRVPRPLSYKSNFEERIVQYKMMKESGGILGAVTRWPTINRTLKGWQDGQLHVLAALTGVGKSWLVALITDDLLLQKRKPLVVSTEMAPIRLQFRLDCIRHKIPFPMIRDGALTEEDEIRWMEAIFGEARDVSSDAIFVGKEEVSSVQDVQLFAQEHGVTDVIIDGGYRLARSREWSDQASIVSHLQLAAEETGIPWIVTTQLGDSSEKGKSYDLKMLNKWAIRYAKEWIIDPDVVMLLSQPKDLKLIRQMEIQIHKWRDGDGKQVSVRIHWEPETMNYDEVPMKEGVSTITVELGEKDDKVKST